MGKKLGAIQVAKFDSAATNTYLQIISAGEVEKLDLPKPLADAKGWAKWRELLFSALETYIGEQGVAYTCALRPSGKPPPCRKAKCSTQ